MKECLQVVNRQSFNDRDLFPWQSFRATSREKPGLVKRSQFFKNRALTALDIEPLWRIRNRYFDPQFFYKFAIAWVILNLSVLLVPWLAHDNGGMVLFNGLAWAFCALHIREQAQKFQRMMFVVNNGGKLQTDHNWRDVQAAEDKMKKDAAARHEGEHHR